MNTFYLIFVPLFVAVDAIGLLPVFTGLVEDVERSRVKRIILQSVITAMVVALIFIVLGQMILRLLGISVADFMVAGGLLLFVLSVLNVVDLGQHQKAVDVESLGAVPIGVPLIVGPAVLTTAILLVDQFGIGLTILATTLNIAFCGLVLWFASPIMRLLGKAGAKTLSKLAWLLLGSIAVMMVRKGITNFFA